MTERKIPENKNPRIRFFSPKVVKTGKKRWIFKPKENDKSKRLTSYSL